ncbi:MAG: ribose-5-phosphate isomerase RpiA [Chlamydiota bacterium]
MEIEEKKKAAAEKAVSLIQNKMIVGLGTGSTVNYFIDSLAKKCKQGLSIEAVASSQASSQRAKNLKIPMIDNNQVTRIDITIDGADEIDPKKRMIKGRGGALLREKILASSSTEVVIIVDDSKLVPTLGKGVVPVEIAYFAPFATQKKLLDLGYKGNFRLDPTGNFFKTDNGNFIFDISFENLCPFPEEEDAELKKIPGILETGFFFHLAHKVIVAYSSSRVEILY